MLKTLDFVEIQHNDAFLSVVLTGIIDIDDSRVKLLNIKNNNVFIVWDYFFLDTEIIYRLLDPELSEFIDDFEYTEDEIRDIKQLLNKNNFYGELDQYEEGSEEEIKEMRRLTSID